MSSRQPARAPDDESDVDRPPEAGAEVPLPGPEILDPGADLDDGDELGAVLFMRAVGLVNGLGAVIGGLLVLGSLWALYLIKVKYGFIIGPTVMRAFYLQRFLLIPALVGLQIALGFGLTRLRPWAYWAQVALSTVVLAFLAYLVFDLIYARFSLGVVHGPPWMYSKALAAGVAQAVLLVGLRSPAVARLASPAYRAMAGTVGILPRLRPRHWIAVAIAAVFYEWGLVRMLLWLAWSLTLGSLIPPAH